MRTLLWLLRLTALGFATCAGLSVALANGIGGQPSAYITATSPPPAADNAAAAPVLARDAVPTALAPLTGYALSVDDRAELCGWGRDTLLEDAALDTDDIGYYPQYADYYRNIAATWTTIAGQIQSWCGDGVAPTTEQCSNTSQWLNHGLSSHVGAVDAESAWNVHWAGNYRELIRLWDGLCV